MEIFEFIVTLLLMISLLRISTSGRLEIYIKMLSLQGLLLFSLIFFTVGHESYMTLAVAVVETLLLKAFFVPFLRFFLLLFSVRESICFYCQPLDHQEAGICVKRQE